MDPTTVCLVVAAARFLLTSSQLRVKLLEPGAPDPTCALASCDVQCPVSAAERLARLQDQIAVRALSLADRQCSVKGSDDGRWSVAEVYCLCVLPTCTAMTGTPPSGPPLSRFYRSGPSWCW